MAGSLPSSSVCPEMLYGVGVVPGIVVGRVQHVSLRDGGGTRLYLPQERISAELDRWRLALKQVEENLRRACAELEDISPGYHAIIDSHLLLLADDLFARRTGELIERLAVNAEWALEKAVEEIQARLDRVTDPYIRARCQDVEQVASRLYRVLSGHALEVTGVVDGDTVVVGRDLTPESLIRLARSGVAGFGTENGGATSHCAIIARSLGIPSVMGVAGIRSRSASDGRIILDGRLGRVTLFPSDSQIAEALEHQARQRRYSERMAVYAPLASETEDGLSVAFKANIETVEEAVQVVESGAAGVGLFRSEYLYLSRGLVPDEDSFTDIYRQLMTVLSPLPVTIRTFDLGGDKGSFLADREKARNPALGLRGIRLSLSEQHVFRRQLAALLRAGRFGRLRILLPMITAPSELVAARQVLAEVQADLVGRGVAFAPEVELGIMIEVPAAAALADVLAREVDFFSIGTNDLIQHSLAIDRGNAMVDYLYDPLSPAILRTISRVIKAGHQAGIEVSLCGEMAGDIPLVPLLVGLGVDELSMTPLAIPYAKRLIRQSRADELATLAQEVLAMSSSEQIAACLAGFLRQRYGDWLDIHRLDRMRQGKRRWQEMQNVVRI